MSYQEAVANRDRAEAAAKAAAEAQGHDPAPIIPEVVEGDEAPKGEVTRAEFSKVCSQVNANFQEVSKGIQSLEMELEKMKSILLLNAEAVADFDKRLNAFEGSEASKGSADGSAEAQT